jgi:SAM-dependent methyltransferase
MNFMASVSPRPDASEPAASAVGDAGLLDILRALGDATRLRIAILLQSGELAVGEIALLLEQSQPRVSRHIRILEEAGLVERRKEGSWVFVRLTRGAAATALSDLTRTIRPSASEARIAEHDRARLSAVQAEREAAASRYFAAHAHEWDGIRSLHVAEADVESAIGTLMRNRRVGHLLDVGTGTGRMVEVLGAGASRVTAIDRSPEMLRIARTRLSASSVPVELVQADFTALPLANDSVDTLVMHQVLHYATSPDAVIAEAARVLRPSGHLLVIDFAPHDREELRRDAAHVRLGFSDGQLRGWFASTGLILETTEALTGGALTVKIWLGRRRSDVLRVASDTTVRKTMA